jgi:hypothetical protein
VDRAADNSLGIGTEHSYANPDGYDDAYPYDNCHADGYAYIHAHGNAHVDPYSVRVLPEGAPRTGRKRRGTPQGC